MSGALVGTVVAISLAGCGTQATTTTLTTTAPAASTASQPTPVAHKQTFNGNGDQDIGTINVPVDSTLAWTCHGCQAGDPNGLGANYGVSGIGDLFMIQNKVPTDSQLLYAAEFNVDSGQTDVPAGVYHNLQVHTGGSWFFTITPN